MSSLESQFFNAPLQELDEEIEFAVLIVLFEHSLSNLVAELIQTADQTFTLLTRLTVLNDLFLKREFLRLPILS